MASTEKDVQGAEHFESLAAPVWRAKIREVAIGLACVALFGAFGVLSQEIKVSGLAARGIGPTFFPTVLAVGGVLLSLLYCASVLVWPRADDSAEAEVDPDAGPFSITRPIAVFVVPVIWTIALPFLGFVVSTWALLTVLVLQFDGFRSRGWLIAPALLTGILWLTFGVVLRVDLPPPSLW